MTTRSVLYAHAARNQVGRLLGTTWAYTPAQRTTARTMWDAFKQALHDDDSCAALLGCVDGETSFLLAARGDHGEAGGALQWHAIRRDLILKHAGIDVWKAGAADQARAVIAETTQPWSWYRHVDEALRAAPTIRGKIMVLVSQLEQSGSQQRDIDRRTPMAEYWRKQFGASEVTS